MIKGGFQGLDISGVDLTAQSPSLPGAYAACQAADGKTVLVLTAAGAVQCSVKKVSTNYVLAGVTGDGKILSIAVGTTDGIEVIETVIPSGDAEVYLDSGVDISTATPSAPYTTEYDGIIRLGKESSEALTSPVVVQSKTGATHGGTAPLLRIPTDYPSGSFLTCFVKKGTILQCANIVSGVVVKFYPYKPVES